MLGKRGRVTLGNLSCSEPPVCALAGRFQKDFRDLLWRSADWKNRRMFSCVSCSLPSSDSQQILCRQSPSMSIRIMRKRWSKRASNMNFPYLGGKNE
jgi:hypothetical protein